MNRLPPLQNSISSPLRIAEILLGESEGRLGLTICPGKKDLPRGWDRDLEKDLRAMRDWGASTVGQNRQLRGTIMIIASMQKTT